MVCECLIAGRGVGFAGEESADVVCGWEFVEWEAREARGGGGG